MSAKRGISSSSQGEGRKDETASDNYDRLQYEAELVRLAKEFRAKEKEFSMYKESTKKHILRDDKEIVLLEKENEECRTILANAEAECHSKKDEQTLFTLQTKLSLNEQMDQDIKREKEKLEDQKVQVDVMEKKIKEERKKMSKQKGGNPKGKIRITEGHLDKANTDLGKRLEENKKSRKAIEGLRRDQAKFQAIYDKMQSQIGLLKNEIRQEQDSCKELFKQREDCVVKRKHLEEREKKEMDEFESERDNLLRVFAHEANFRKFLAAKAKDISDGEVMAEEERKQRALAYRIRTAQELLTEYEDAYMRIVEITGESDCNVIVERFLKFDAEMFSMFNYIDELERQVGEMEYLNMKIEEEQMALQGSFDQKEKDRTARLSQMDSENQRIQAEQVELEKRSAGADKQLDELLSRAQESYIKLSEKDDTLTALLEESGGQVTYRNALLYLGGLETRADQLIAAKVFLTRDSKDDNDRAESGDLLILAKEDLEPPKSPSSHIIDNIPDYNSSASDDDILDNYPLSPDDIKRRLNIKM